MLPLTRHPSPDTGTSPTLPLCLTTAQCWQSRHDDLACLTRPSPGLLLAMLPGSPSAAPSPSNCPTNGQRQCPLADAGSPGAMSLACPMALAHRPSPTPRPSPGLPNATAWIPTPGLAQPCLTDARQLRTPALTMECPAPLPGS